MTLGQRNPDQFLKPIDPNDSHVRHELANLVLTGVGPSEEAMVAPEPPIYGSDMINIVTASKKIPENPSDDTIAGSRTHWGSGPLGEGPSFSQLKALSHPVDPFSAGVKRAAYLREQARRLS